MAESWIVAFRSVLIAFNILLMVFGAITLHVAIRVLLRVLEEALICIAHCICATHAMSPLALGDVAHTSSTAACSCRSSLDEISVTRVLSHTCLASILCLAAPSMSITILGSLGDQLVLLMDLLLACLLRQEHTYALFILLEPAELLA